MPTRSRPFRTSGTPLPPRSPLPPGLASEGACSHPVSEDYLQQGACQSWCAHGGIMNAIVNLLPFNELSLACRGV